MPTKEIAVATGILVLCLALLFMAHNEPEGYTADPGPAGLGGGDVIAGQIDTPSAPPSERTPGPPLGGSNDDGGLVSSGDDNVFNFGDDDGGLALGHDSGSLMGDDDPFGGITTGGDTGGDDFIARQADRLRNGDTGTATTTAGVTGTSGGTSGRPLTVSTTASTTVAATSSVGRSGGGTHVVARGETLMDISFKHYQTHQQWRAIRDANDVDPNELDVGQVLAIPQLSNVVRAQDRGQVTGNKYVVKQGDSYYTIARDVLGNAARFQELRDLNSVDAYDLMPGMTIVLPAGPRVAAAGAATPRAAADNRTLPNGARWHTVERGEVLGTISQRFYGTARRWREIASANNITDPNNVPAGMKLIIPKAAGVTPAPAARNQPEAQRNGPGQWHTVSRGEVLGMISQQHYGTATRWREIVAANPGIKPNNLVVGSRLWIPKSSGTASPRRVIPVQPAQLTPRRNTDLTWPELNDPAPARTGGGGSGNAFDLVE